MLRGCFGEAMHARCRPSPKNLCSLRQFGTLSSRRPSQAPPGQAPPGQSPALPPAACIAAVSPQPTMHACACDGHKFWKVRSVQVDSSITAGAHQDNFSSLHVCTTAAAAAMSDIHNEAFGKCGMDAIGYAESSCIAAPSK
jgi:hypothetical protein